MDPSDQGGAPPARTGGEQRVIPLELFFDLVFVFALTQVTGFLTHHLTWLGMLQGAALLAALWTAWEGYSWLTNAVPAEEVIPARLLIFCSMASMFVASLAVPGAFGRYGVIFGVAYFMVPWCISCRCSCRCSPPDASRSAARSSGSRRASWAPRRCSSWPASSTASLRARSGRWRSVSATVWRSCVASRASGSIRGTSPSVTASL